MKKIVTTYLVCIILTLSMCLLACNSNVDFKVNFVVDGEIYSTLSTSGEEIISIPQNPTKDGYEFDGWYWDEGKWQKPFTANSLLNEPISSDMSVYAKWNKMETDPTPELSGVDITSSALTVSGETATLTVSNAIKTFSFLNDITVAKDATYILASDIGCQNTIASKTVALEEGDNTYYLLVTNSDTQKLYTVTIRRRPIYTVEFNVNGGICIETLYIEENNAVEKQETAKIGYTFEGWVLDGETVTFPYTVKENITFNAKYNAITYTIEYHLNNGNNSPENVKNYTTEQTIVLNAPTRDYYAFNGWYENENFEGRTATKIEQGTTGNKVFYAKWTPVQYEIKYELNGGTNNESNVFTYNVEEETALNNPTKNYYSFEGWYETKNFDGSAIEKIETGSHGNKTFYAKWTPVKYEIKYELNGGTNNENNVFTYNVEQAIALGIPTKDHYTFNGWYENENFEGRAVTKIEQGTTGNKVFYAKWTPVQYEIKYKLNGGSNKNPTSFTIEDLPLSLYDSTNNRDFLGWYTDEAFTKKVEQIDSPENVTIYAKWGGLVYQESSTYVTVIGFDGDETEVIIPSTFNEKSVTTINQSAFSNCLSLKSISIPSSVTRISNKSFENCTVLEEVYINTTLEFGRLGDCFYNAGTDGEGITVIIGKDVINIPSYYFSEYYNSDVSYSPKITNIIFEEGSHCQTIDDGAFNDCNNLISVTLPNSITSIGNSAFRDCVALTYISLPDSVTSIGESVFYNCASLTSISLPDSVTSIGEFAFDDCASLTSITLPNSITNIGKHAFYGCYSLTSITLPDSITSIGSSAFSYCTGLAKINIPSGVTKIETATFFYCRNLTSITIPENVESIGDNAFTGCSKLVEIYNLSNVETGTNFGSFGYDAKVIHTSLDEDSILEIVDDYIFMTWQEKYYLMGYAANDSRLVLPDNYNGNNYSIYDFAFSSRHNITSVVIPEGVTKIEMSAFYDCTNLISVVIPSSVTSIRTNGTFDKCVSLTSITVDENNKYYKSIDGNLYSKDGKTLIRYAIGKTDTSFIVPEGMTIIGDYAFSGCSSLVSVTIPNSVTSIETNAFNACTNLSNIVIPDSVTSMQWMVFNDCDNLTIYCEAETQPAGWNSSWNYDDCIVVWGYNEQ